MKVNGNNVKLNIISFFIAVCFFSNNSYCQETYSNVNSESLNNASKSCPYDSLKLILKDIYTKDQTLRQVYRCFKDKYSDNSNEMKYYWNIIEKQDSINLITIVDILNKYGWLGINDIGSQGNKTIFLVIQHSDIEIRERFAPLLKKSVNNGESKGEYYALLIDKILVKRGLEQEYGTQIKVNQATGQYELHPIRDQKNVNKRRAKYGMKPINDYLKYYNIVLKGIN